MSICEAAPSHVCILHMTVKMLTRMCVWSKQRSAPKLMFCMMMHSMPPCCNNKRPLRTPLLHLSSTHNSASMTCHAQCRRPVQLAAHRLDNAIQQNHILKLWKLQQFQEVCQRLPVRDSIVCCFDQSIRPGAAARPAEVAATADIRAEVSFSSRVREGWTLPSEAILMPPLHKATTPQISARSGKERAGARDIVCHHLAQPGLFHLGHLRVCLDTR